ncbi:MAG: carboxypeptidase-like regulatory domain-containing protein [Sedimentisphaerales bacterium]
MKKKINILIIIVILTVGIAGYLSYTWYWATHTGSRSGRIIDAVTGKPIEGVVVNYTWKFSAFMMIVYGGSHAVYETTTDKDGYYLIPNQRVKKRVSFFDGLVPETVIIYKNNYAVYQLLRTYKKPPIGRSFGYTSENQPYFKKNNLVKLYPWKKGESHEKHISWINTALYSCPESELLRKEIQEERKRATEENLAKYK